MRHVVVDGYWDDKLWDAMIKYYVRNVNENTEFKVADYL